MELDAGLGNPHLLQPHAADRGEPGGIRINPKTEGGSQPPCGLGMGS